MLPRMESDVTHSPGALSAPNASTFGLILSGIVLGLRKIGRAVKNRHRAAMLAQLDDHLLADVGLTRADLDDANRMPLWRDPIRLLQNRAKNRRLSRYY